MGLLSLLNSLTSDERVESVLAARAEAVAEEWAESQRTGKDFLDHFIEPRFLVRKEDGQAGAQTAPFADSSEIDALSDERAREMREAFQPLGDPGDDGPTRLKNLLTLGNRIVVTEDAGAGKSIFTRYAVAWLSTPEAWKRMNDRGLPILAVRFERLDESWPLSVEGYREELERQIAKYCLGREPWTPGNPTPAEAKSIVEHALREGRVVLFCDALDQLIGDEAPKQIKAFMSFESELLKDYRDVKVVITSRAAAFKDWPEYFRDWKSVKIAGFSPIDQVRYLRDLIPAGAIEGRDFESLTDDDAVEILSDDRVFGAMYHDVDELLQTPVILSFVRVIAKNAGGSFPRFANRADLYFQATSGLLDRSLEKVGRLTEQEQSELRDALAATAFAMMILEAGGYAVRGASQVKELRRLAKSFVPSELADRWSDLWSLVERSADVSSRLIVENKSDDLFGWKHKGMMEFYAGLFLANNQCVAWKAAPIAVADDNEELHCLTDLVAQPGWNWAVRFAIELPQASDRDAWGYVKPPILCRSLAALFEPPSKDLRPTKLMYRTWSLFQAADTQDLTTLDDKAVKKLKAIKSEGQKILASFQNQFTKLLTGDDLEKARIAAQLVPEFALRDLVKDQDRLAALLPPEDQPAFVLCPPKGWTHPTDPGRDPCIFWIGTASSQKHKYIYNDERPRHPVRLTPFWMQSTSVTNEQYALFDPAFEKSAEHRKYFSDFSNERDCPVIMTHWFDATMFALWTGAQLPTEAQREFAARAGRDGVVELFGVPCNGQYDQLTSQVANFNGRHAFPDAEIDSKKVYAETTLPVRWTDRRRAESTLEEARKPHAFQPNAWRLWQMQGNVWEWCSSIPDDYRQRAHQLTGLPLESSIEEFEAALSKFDPSRLRELPATHDFSAGARRVLRGGGWYSRGNRCRAAARDHGTPGVRLVIGFRLCRCLPSPSRP